MSVLIPVAAALAGALVGALLNAWAARRAAQKRQAQEVRAAAVMVREELRKNLFYLHIWKDHGRPESREQHAELKRVTARAWERHGPTLISYLDDESGEAVISAATELILAGRLADELETSEGTAGAGRHFTLDMVGLDIADRGKRAMAILDQLISATYGRGPRVVDARLPARVRRVMASRRAK